MSDKFVRLLKEYHSLAHVQHPKFKVDMEASTIATVIPTYLGTARETEIMELVKKLDKEDKNWHLIWELATLTNQHLPVHANNTAGKYEVAKLVKPSKLRLRRIRELIAEIKRVYPHHVLDIIFDPYMPYSQFLSKTVVGFANKANTYEFHHMYNNNQNKQHGMHLIGNEHTHTSNKHTRKSNVIKKPHKKVVGISNKAKTYEFHHMYNNNQNKQHGMHVIGNEPTHTSNKNTRKSNVIRPVRRGVSFKNTANVKEFINGQGMTLNIMNQMK